MRTLRAIIGSFALAGFAQDVQVVKTSKYGAFQFSSVSVSNKTFFGRTSCTISGKIINKTDASWSDSEFTVTLLGTTNAEKALLSLKVISIPFGKEVPFSTYCYLPSGQIADYPSFDPDSYLIVFEGGSRYPSPEAEKKEAAAARAATAAKDKARAEYLSKFPTIQSGFNSAFIGSDKKCSSQFLEATAMEGLEKRKRLTDLVAFGCGFIARNGTHVSVESKDGTFARVRVIDGDKAGQYGWVPLSWVK